MTTFTATNHQNKSAPYIEALFNSHYRWVEKGQKADLLLTDHDCKIADLHGHHVGNGR